MVGVLALLSLALLSVYFREAPGGPLHDAQSAGATVLRPLQVGAERVARPFRDLYGWFDGLIGAKAENERLRERVAALEQQAVENQTAAQENDELRDQLAFKDLPGIEDFRTVNTRVVGHPPSQNQKERVIAAGSSNGVRLHAPVLSGGALIGVVTAVSSRTSLVTLITDEATAVAARVLRTTESRAAANGLVQAGAGDSLILDRVTKNKDVRVGDLIITAGSRVERLPSLFPRGIRIGFVSYVNQTDTEPFKQIQVEPIVDLDDVYAVTVLIR